ncbi:MAG: ABC transporter permease [Mycoplasmatales bacterium]|nr:ABC transporter permease [Mycoplasmatales bacterium]
MFKYMRLQLFLVSKKISTYIVPIAFAISFFLVIGIPILIAQKEGVTESMVGLGQLDPLMLMLPFIVTAIFVAIKALNIFKDSEEDGTELLIVSKPITRFKVVLGKFVSLYSLMFLFSMFTFIIVSLITLIDKNATSMQRIEFAASIAFGTLIVQFLLSSIIVFFASVLGKIGTMTLSILIPLIVSIASTILIPMSNSKLEVFGNNFTHSYVSKDKNGEFKISKIYGYKEYKNDDNDNAKKQLKNHESSWYKTAAYFDVWTQLSSFYSIFQEGNPTPNSLSKWKETNKRVDIRNIIDPQTIYKDPTSGKVYYIDVQRTNENHTQKNNLKLLNTAKDLYPNVANNVASQLNSLVQPLESTSFLKDITKIINQNNYNFTDQDGKMISLYVLINILNDHKINKSLDKIVDGGINTLTYSNFISSISDDLKDIAVIEGKPYVPKALVYTMWLFIAFGVGALVMVRYMRRDFK